MSQGTFASTDAVNEVQIAPDSAAEVNTTGNGQTEVIVGSYTQPLAVPMH